MNRWQSVQVSRAKLFKLWHLATPRQLEEGLRWFEEANRIALGLARLASKPLFSVAGVIASLSPASSWERNLEEAHALLLGQPINHATYPANVLKARKILAGESPEQVLNGKKVMAFYKLIANPADGYSVCVDRHAVRACTLRRWTGDKEHAAFLRSQYDRCADAYRSVAEMEGVLPHQLQATVWTVQRER